MRNKFIARFQPSSYCFSQVNEDSTPEKVRFKSTVFASSFGDGLFIGPNTIDFGSVFDDFGAKLLENIHVFLTMILLVLGYVALLPVVRIFDKLDILKVIYLQSQNAVTPYLKSKQLLPFGYAQ